MMLSFAGGTVHMVCRNKERGESAQEEIKQQADNDVKKHNIDIFLSNSVVSILK